MLNMLFGGSEKHPRHFRHGLIPLLDPPFFLIDIMIGGSEKHSRHFRRRVGPLLDPPSFLIDIIIGGSKKHRPTLRLAPHLRFIFVVGWVRFWTHRFP